MYFTIFCMIFGAIYERFSHEVYSYYMIYAFSIPLLLVVLPLLLISSSRCKASPCGKADRKTEGKSIEKSDQKTAEKSAGTYDGKSTGTSAGTYGEKTTETSNEMYDKKTSGKSAGKRFSSFPYAGTLMLWNYGAVTLTIGCLFRGALDIYGTTNRLVWVYPAVSLLLFVSAAMLQIHKKQLTGSAATDDIPSKSE